MSDRAAEGELWNTPPPLVTRALFGSLPLLAALGPVLTVRGGLFAFRIACVAIVGYAVVFLLARRPWSVADVLLLLTTVAFLLSGLAGLPRITPDSGDPYPELLAVLLGLSTALAARGWQRRSPRLYLALVRGWVVAGLLMCALAAVELATGIHWPGYLESADPDPAVAFGNPNVLAVFVTMAGVWAIPVRRHGGPGWRAATWALLLATAFTLVVTHARIALVVWLLVTGWAAWREMRRSRHPLASLGEALVPLVAAIAVLVLGSRLAGYVLETGTAGSSGSVREELARRGLTIAWDNHGLPTWPGSFEHFMVEAADPVPVAFLVNAHNMWVEVLVQYGAATLVLLLAWLGACVVAGRAARDELAAGAVALLLLALVDSSFLDDASLWAFVLTLAVASRVQDPGGPGEPHRPPRPHATSAPPAHTGARREDAQ